MTGPATGCSSGDPSLCIPLIRTLIPTPHAPLMRERVGKRAFQHETEGRLTKEAGGFVVE